MKTNYHLLISLLLAFLLIDPLQAQPPSIDSLRVIPANPTSNDTIKIIAYTSWGIDPCSMTDDSVTVMGNVVIVMATHLHTGIFMPCNSTDTVMLGTFNAGNYTLDYYLIDDPIILDTMSISFTVQPASGIQNNSSEEEIKIYPNPFSTAATVFIDDKIPTSSAEIRMHDMFGREISRRNEIKNNEISIARGNLAAGIYFVSVVQNDKKIHKRKVVIE